MLNDRTIREALVSSLQNKKNKPQRIIHELSVSNGNAIADVVAIYRESHCFEIKGEGDKVERLKIQGVHYNSAFRKITLITTAKHEKKALNYAPAFWGIIIAKEKAGRIVFNHLRKALSNPFFDKKIALQTLWKEEMAGILSELKINLRKKDMTRENIGLILSQELGKKELSEKISSVLILRKSSFIKHIS